MAFDFDVAVAVTANVNVRIEIIGNVFVSRCGEDADTGSRNEFPQIESNDFGEWPVERGGEFVEQKEVLSAEW